MGSKTLAIVGSGPAGLTAAIYASRYQVDTAVFGQKRGGTIGLAHAVENYPGFASVSGLELMAKIEAQVKKLGAKIEYDPVAEISRQDGGIRLVTESAKASRFGAVILATGTRRRHLNVPGEKALLGRGVSYCTTCDAPFFKDKGVVVVGGGDSAVSGALHAAAFASRVWLVCRKEELGAEPIWVKQALGHPRIEPIYKTNVTAISGQNLVEKVSLDRPFEGKDWLATSGVFIEIGGVPINELAASLGLDLNSAGYIKVDREMKTGMPGIFAAGDNTDFWPHFQQMVTAQAQGAVAATTAYKYLSENSF